MKKIIKCCFVLALFLSLFGFTGCGGDAKVVEKPGNNKKTPDADNELPILPGGVIDYSKFYASTYIKVHKDAVGAPISFRDCLASGVGKTYFENRQWYKWNKQSEKWDSIEELDDDGRIIVYAEIGVNYYCFTYTNDSKHYVSPVITIECGTKKTNAIGNFVYRDGTYSENYNSAKEFVGFVADVNDWGYPVLILYKTINNNANSNTKTKATEAITGYNTNFTNQKDYNWHLPELNEFQQVFANSTLINQKIADNNLPVNNLLRSGDNIKYYLAEEKRSGTYNFIRIESGSFEANFICVSDFNVGKEVNDYSLKGKWYKKDNSRSSWGWDVIDFDTGKKLDLIYDKESNTLSYSDMSYFSFDSTITVQDCSWMDWIDIISGSNGDVSIGPVDVGRKGWYRIKNGLLTYEYSYYDVYGGEYYRQKGKMPAKYKGIWTVNDIYSNGLTGSLTVNNDCQFGVNQTNGQIANSNCIFYVVDNRLKMYNGTEYSVDIVEEGSYYYMNLYNKDYDGMQYLEYPLMQYKKAK
ncbi:MAG: hypothetical protein IKX23_00590 [Treponema sp.]|nr:hypothetical protein [Treponema sp.]